MEHVTLNFTHAHKRNIFILHMCALFVKSEDDDDVFQSLSFFSPIVYFSLIKNCQRCFLNESIIFFTVLLTPLHSSAVAEERQLETVKLWEQRHTCTLSRWNNWGYWGTVFWLFPLFSLLPLPPLCKVKRLFCKASLTETNGTKAYCDFVHRNLTGYAAVRKTCVWEEL